MRNTVLFLLSLLLFISCENNDEVINNDEVVQINYGTSFGFCYGYCFNEIAITNSDITIHKKAFTDNAIFPDIVSKENVEAELLENFFSKVSYDDFLVLDEVIGCPDCSDGGTEWIEITTKDNTHKVSFDYYLDDEPEELTAIIEPLRDLYDSFQRNAYVVTDYDLYTETEIDNYIINDVVVEGDVLKLSIVSGGCDGNSWIGLLVDAESILESLPLQRALKLNLLNPELCLLAGITKTFEFDISGLQVNGENTVHFNLEGWDETIVYNY